MTVQSVQSVHEHPRLTPAVENAVRWLVANPGYKSVRKAALVAGVSTGTMHAAVKEFERQRSYR